MNFIKRYEELKNNIRFDFMKYLTFSKKEDIYNDFNYLFLELEGYKDKIFKLEKLNKWLEKDNRNKSKLFKKYNIGEVENYNKG